MISFSNGMKQQQFWLSLCQKSRWTVGGLSVSFAIHLFQMEQKVSKQLNYSDYPLTNERLQMRVNY